MLLVRFVITIALVTLMHISAMQAHAQVPDTAESQVDQSALQLLGQASFRAAFFHIYDAQLWAPETGFSWDMPFRLKLTYARKIKAQRLVEISLEEMARIHSVEPLQFEPLRAHLSSCFKDVSKGDIIEGVSENPNTVYFLVNGAQTCRLTQPGISYNFFSIWLSERSRSPRQARRLRAM